jgi:hypothetical protein
MERLWVECGTRGQPPIARARLDPPRPRLDRPRPGRGHPHAHTTRKITKKKLETWGVFSPHCRIMSEHLPVPENGVPIPIPAPTRWPERGLPDPEDEWEDERGDYRRG